MRVLAAFIHTLTRSGAYVVAITAPSNLPNRIYLRLRDQLAKVPFPCELCVAHRFVNELQCDPRFEL
jgi:hypothetical protein